MSVSIRSLEAEDEAAWRKLWAGYLAYYKTILADEVTDEIFKRLLVGAPHFAFVAEQDDEVVGFVHALPHPSTWSNSDYCYLEDLYVDESVRGGGVGRALIQTVYAEADKRGCARVYWHTESSNDRARRLYDTLASVTNFVQYRRG